MIYQLLQTTIPVVPVVINDAWTPDRILNLAVSILAILIAVTAVAVSVVKAYQKGGWQAALNELSMRLESYQTTNNTRISNNANHAAQINTQMTTLARDVGEAKAAVQVTKETTEAVRQAAEVTKQVAEAVAKLDPKPPQTPPPHSST
jgi:Tfp pilus assembly protein PilE